MWASIVEWCVTALAVYLAVGLAFAVPFVLRWVGRIDADAEHGTWGFRLAIAPGVIALWPLLARRVYTRTPPRERNAHRDAAGGTP